jgi:hypothetical protein
MFDLEAHLKRQMAFSRATFGPGERRAGVIDHIRRELVEVERAEEAATEWVDVVILALDGLTRRLVECGWDHNEAAEKACRMIVQKQTRNERRDWPDWRTAAPDQAIEHVRNTEDEGPAALAGLRP